MAARASTRRRTVRDGAYRRRTLATHFIELTVALVVLAGIAPTATAADATPAVTITSIAPASASYGESVTISGSGFGGPNVDIRVGGVRALVVTATGARATFLVPTGVPIGATTVTATNPGGRMGSVTFDLNGRVTLALDEPHRVEQAVGPAGGSLTTISNGVTYTLTIPPGALIDTESIVLTPVSGMAGLPLDALLGAAHFAPEGLTFGKAATLTVGLPAAAKTHGLAAFSADGNGTNLHLVPFTTTDTTAIAIAVPHFTVTGAGTGSNAAVAAIGCAQATLECTYLNELGMAEVQAEQSVCGADCSTPADLGSHTSDIEQAELQPITSLLGKWFTDADKLLTTTGAVDDAGLQLAGHEYETWRAWVNSAAFVCFGFSSCEAVPAVTADINIGDDDLAVDLRAAFQRANATCNDQRVADLIREVDQLQLEGRGGLPANDDGLKQAYGCQLVISTSLPLTVNNKDTVPLIINVGVRSGSSGATPVAQANAPVTIEITDGCGALGPSGDGRVLNAETDQSGVVTSELRITSTCVGSTTSTTLDIGVADLIDPVSGGLIALGRSVSYTTHINAPLVTIVPNTAIVNPGATIDYSATAPGLGPLFKWSATGGTITPGPSATATFTAGSTSGAFTVTATSVDDPTVKGTATVTVVSNNPIALIARTCSAQAFGQSFFGVRTLLQSKSCPSFPPYSVPDLTINDSVDLYTYKTDYTEDLSPLGGTLDIVAEVDAPLVGPSVTTNPNGVVTTAFSDLTFNISDGGTYLLTIQATVSTNNIFSFNGPILDIRGSNLPDKLIFVDPSTCVPGGDGIPPSCLQNVQFSELVTGGTVEITPVVMSGFTTVGIVDQQKRKGEVKLTFTFQKQ